MRMTKYIQHDHVYDENDEIQVQHDYVHDEIQFQHDHIHDEMQVQHNHVNEEKNSTRSCTWRNTSSTRDYCIDHWQDVDAFIQHGQLMRLEDLSLW